MNDFRNSFPNIFMKVTYGLDTSQVSSIGYTRESLRNSFVDMISDGDLVLLYGARQNSPKDLRGKAFLIAQIEATKRDDPKADRWQFGIPISRAWETIYRIPIEELAYITYLKHSDQASLTRGVKLEDSEAARVLYLSVKEVSVIGSTSCKADLEQETTLATVVRPSRGGPIAAGTRTSIYPDGVYELYLFQLVGFDRRDIFKIGISMVPAQRLSQLNGSFPPNLPMKFEKHRSVPVGKGRTALKVEDAAKAKFEVDFTSLGGEFFSGQLNDILNLFDQISYSYTSSSMSTN